MLKLKLQYFGHLMWRADSLEKDPHSEKDWRQEEKGTTEDEMVGWHHWLNGYEFERTLDIGKDGESWCTTVHGAANSQTGLSNWTATGTSPVAKRKRIHMQCRRCKRCGLIPGSGRAPGEGNGNPLQYSCLDNSMGRGALWATVHGVAKSQTRLKRLSTHMHFCTVLSVGIRVGY